MLIPPGEVERIVAARYSCHGHSSVVRDGTGTDWVCDGEDHSPDCPARERGYAMETVGLVLTAATAAHEKVVEDLRSMLKRSQEAVLQHHDRCDYVHCAVPTLAEIDAALSSVTFGGGK